MRTFGLIRIVTYALLAWLAVSLLGRWHWLLVLLVSVLAISNVAICWMLREARPTLATLCRRRPVGWYVSWVCFFIGEPHPLETEASTGRELLLRSQRDFDIARERAKQIVRGHDAVIDSVLSRTYENLTLRKSRRSANNAGPLASFLLVGAKGVGKRYLARVIAKLLYGTSGIEVLDCERLTTEALIGTKDHEGQLMRVVRERPCSLLLFESVEQASRDVAGIIGDVLATGRLKQPGADGKTSFADATIVLTTTKATESLEALADAGDGDALFHRRAIERLGEETQIDRQLFSAVTDICVCGRPSDRTKGEVVSLLMQQECRLHGMQLTHVDPEIIATQVLQLDDGFGLAPQRIKKLMRGALVAAAPERPPTLSLRVRRSKLPV